MAEVEFDDFSLKVMAFFMKIMGVWFATTRGERMCRIIALYWTLMMLIWGLCLAVMVFSHYSEDIENGFFGMSNFLSTFVPMCKILILLPQKEKFFRLVKYMANNFLKGDYDEQEKSILNDTKRKCTFFVCSTIGFTEMCVAAYLFTPLYVNIGRNESTRILPFKLWLKNVPVQESPYFELCYVSECLSVYMIGCAYFCIESILCIINLHLAGQFRILQYRVSNKYMRQNQKKDDHESKNFLYLANNASDVFKSCIRQHQALIQYSEEVEEVFSPVVLVQVMAFSMLICLDGYQVLLVELWQRRVIFFFHTLMTVCQLVMFSYSCDCVIRESTELATAAYSGPWLQLPATKRMENVKKDLIMLIMRSSKPCCLTGLGFFDVSLETCTSVITTAGSYFTLLQESQSNNNS